MVRDQLDGCLPVDHQGWISLPGIGPYTAGAVSSIGLGLPEAAVDTNVDRIIRRLVCDTEQLNTSLTPSVIQRLAQTFLDPSRPGDWNQGLMDLGAGLCSPVSPSCDECPLSSSCVSYQLKMTDKIPAAPKRLKPTLVSLSILVAHDQYGYLVVPPGADPVVELSKFGPPARSHYDNLYRGYCQFPTSTWIEQPSGKQAADYLSATQAAWGQWLNPGERSEINVVGRYSHTITRYRLSVTVIACTTSGKWGSRVPRDRWQQEKSQYPLATLSLKALMKVPGAKEY
jgi:adenine-specific DNA glycosylase